MNSEDALVVVDTIIKPNYLNTVQELVFHHCWLGQTYQEISKVSGYDPDYVRVIGSKLWQSLSSALGEKVTKHNFRAVLREQMRRPEFADLLKQGRKSTPLNFSQWPESSSIAPISRTVPLQDRSSPTSTVNFPGNPLALQSPLYIERTRVEDCAYEAIAKPGMLLRIKAAEKMGKTSLMVRILAHATSLQMRTVRLNFCQADETTLDNLDSFLKWFCANISQQLHLEANPADCWNERLGSKISATIFLQNHVLDVLKAPLVIALDEVDWLFKHKTLARDFLPLLRLWHEESNNVDVWQNLRMIVVHCTERYPLLDLNHSPFNVGVPIELDELEYEQCLTLASHYQAFFPETLDLETVMATLYKLVGGHPYLLALALYYLTQRSLSLDDILQNAPTQQGIYKSHLQTHLIAVQQNPPLIEALSQVVSKNQPVHVDVWTAHQLYSLGLVTFVGNDVQPRCELYRQYFRAQLHDLA
ncbi:MAG: AAA-like domain-containing protein [Cyanobacteria bacterium P01_F01_bin.150]